MVDRLDALLLDRHQLHRPPDALRSQVVHCHNAPRPTVSLKRRRLFAHRLLVPDRVRRHVAGGRHDHRRHRHSTGTHTRHDLVVRFEHAARPGEFCAVVQHFPYHAGNRGRIQLAGRQQNRGGMVSRPGARSGGRHFRQRLERGRISGSLLCSVSGDSLWLALRFSNLRAAGIPLAHSLDQHLPPARPPSQRQRRRAQVDSSGPRDRQRLAPEGGRPLAAFAQTVERLGNRSWPFADRSHLVVLHLLAAQIPARRARLRPQAYWHAFRNPVSRVGPGQLHGRPGFRIFDQARDASRSGAEMDLRSELPAHPGGNSGGAHAQPVLGARSHQPGDVGLRELVDHGAHAPLGPLSPGRCSLGDRPERPGRLGRQRPLDARHRAARG